MSYASPETLLDTLGVEEPEEIDLEAIAFHCGAVVRYRTLDGCVARIVGRGNRAVITVDEFASHGRRRFSIGHELGHWMRDRGKSGHLCQKSDLKARWDRSDPESLANAYAAGLLMPVSMFKPRAHNQQPSFDTVRGLAKTFKTSRPATAIRLVQYCSFPVLLVAYGRDGRRKWFKPSPQLEGLIWPRAELSHETQAFELLYGGTASNRPVQTRASEWLERRGAYRHDVWEDSIKTDDEVLSMIWWKRQQDLDALLS